MSISTDRRATGVNRVSVDKTIVEICGRDAQVPAFEADAVELSGRGMHVRTEYLPELNAPLVLRFEDHGREVVVEGEVAWRREGEQSAEFGIKFTALDSRSVEVLRDLCSTANPPQEPAKKAMEQGAGSPVKLHIEGLTAPMKARVRDSNGRRVQVGSNLEFLRVGRSIEVEDVDQGERRDAKIDSVTVAIDPQTQVPQLVVALRYAGEITPEPSVVDADSVAAELDAAGEPCDEQSWDEGEQDDLGQAELADDADDLSGPEAMGDRMKERLASAASSFGVIARRSGATMGAFSVGAAQGLGKFAQGLGHQIAVLKARTNAGGVHRRTAGAPAAPRPIRLQPQHRGNRVKPGAARAEVSAGSSRKARPVRLIAASLLLIVGTVGTTLALSRGRQSDDKKAEAVETLATQVAAKPEVAAVGATPGAQQAPTAGTAAEQGIVADVPLFGPTTLATAQPEPLAVAPIEMGYEDQAPDQAFEQDPAESSAKASEAKAEDIKPWGTGKLHLPTVHRLRLSSPGKALKGFTKSNGFSVLIPDRKVTDNPKAIVKRDDRIKSVTADSTPEGAVINFKFRGPVPTYKVRLKNDYIEFFISAPE